MATELERRIKANMEAYRMEMLANAGAANWGAAYRASERWQALNELRATPQPLPLEGASIWARREVQVIADAAEAQAKKDPYAGVTPPAKPATIAESARCKVKLGAPPASATAQQRLPIEAGIVTDPEEFR